MDLEFCLRSAAVARPARALADFARLVELFDEHGVTFVLAWQTPDQAYFNALRPIPAAA